MRTTSPLGAIKEYCLECCCGQKNEVKHCTVTDCALYDFRFGHKPKNTEKNGGFSDDVSTDGEIIIESV